MRGQLRARLGTRSRRSPGARRRRPARPPKACSRRRPLDRPDRSGFAAEAPVTAGPGFPSRDPGTRELRPPAPVGAPARGAFPAARDFPLRAGHRPDPAPPARRRAPRLPDRHRVPATLRLPPRRPARAANLPHPGPALPARPPAPCLAGACATPLAAASRTSRTTSDNYLHHGHLGDLLRVDFLEEASSPLRASTRLDRLSCGLWRSNSTHG